MILSVIVSLIYSVSGTASVAIQATGNMKAFQIGICVILLMELPIAYLLLKWDVNLMLLSCLHWLHTL